MLDPVHFRLRVVRPACEALDLWSASAENLLVGTALAMSGLKWLVQLGGGPAQGLFQIEPMRERDVWRHYLIGCPQLAAPAFEALGGEKPQYSSWPGALIEGRWRPADDQLAVNLVYAAMIARLIYRRRPEPLPQADHILALGHYWERHFNTFLGRDAAGDFVQLYRKHVLSKRRTDK